MLKVNTGLPISGIPAAMFTIFTGMGLGLGTAQQIMWDGKRIAQEH